MLNGGETADRLIDYSLRFGDMAIRLTGKATFNLVQYLTALSKDNKKTKGKTRLVRMLKEGRSLKVFQIDPERMKEFARLAKKYGILFTALRDKKNPDNMIDLMVKADDQSKVSRVLQRLEIASFDAGEINATIEKDQAQANPIKGRIQNSQSERSLNSRSVSDSETDRPSVRQILSRIRAEFNKNRKMPEFSPDKHLSKSGKPRKGR
jgi:signal recognition particle subunit SEC65